MRLGFVADGFCGDSAEMGKAEEAFDGRIGNFEMDDPWQSGLTPTPTLRVCGLESIQQKNKRRAEARLLRIELNRND